VGLDPKQLLRSALDPPLAEHWHDSLLDPHPLEVESLCDRANYLMNGEVKRCPPGRNWRQRQMRAGVGEAFAGVNAAPEKIQGVRGIESIQAAMASRRTGLWAT
jgi:hypothetical protein